MKLQAVMNRSNDEQGTDLLDIVRLMLDDSTRPTALTEIADVDSGVASDMALHVNWWFVDQQQQSLTRIRHAGGSDVTADDLDLVAELLTGALQRQH